MNRAMKTSFATGSAVLAIAALAQGCARQAAQVEQPDFRQTAATAPADLQLVCAAEAARVYEVASDRVLPVSSFAEGEIFTVVLNADGTQAVCTVDNEGTVLSLVRT